MADEWKIKGFWMKTLFVIAAANGVLTLLWFVLLFLMVLLELAFGV